MILKPIKWSTLYGKPKNGTLDKFRIRGQFEGVLEGSVEAFYISNEIPYDKEKTKINCVYLSRSIPYTYGRRNHILTFKTIKEAKDRAQEICFKLVIDKFFIKERKLSRKVILEKFNGKNHTRTRNRYKKIVQQQQEEDWLPYEENLLPF